MNTVARAFAKPFTGLVSAFKRFPISIVFCLISCVSLGMYYGFNFAEPIYLQITVSAISGIILNIIASMLLEKYEKLSPYKVIMYVIGSVLPLGMVALLYFFSSNTLGIARAFVVLICLVIAYLLIPGHKSEYFNFDKMIFVSIRAGLVSFLYSAAIGISISVVFAIVKNLLFQSLPNKIYGYIAIFSLLILALFFLSLLPKFDTVYEEKATKTARYFERIVAFIFVPLLTLTTLIFLGYGAKLLITWDFPTSNFGFYSLIYLVVGIVIYLLTEPIKNDLCVFYRKFFPKVMVVITALLALATYFRVKSYGITESRYLLIVFIVFCVFCAVIFNFLEEKNNRKAFVVFGILAVIAVMPFINFKTVSNYSQSNRGEIILKRNNMLEQGVLSVTPQNIQAISEEDKTQLADVVYYLTDNNSQSYANWLPDDFKMNEFSLYFGYAPKKDIADTNYFYKTYSIDNNVLNIDGYKTMITPTNDRYEYGNISSAIFKTETHQYFIEIRDNNINNTLTLTIKRDDATIYLSEISVITDMIKKDLYEYRKLPADENSQSLNSKLPFDNMTFKASAQGTDVMLVFNSINANETFDVMGKTVLNLFYDLNIFVKD
ncbi:MAG: DUF4153 domain-containing protein [Clostridia bacterium]